jgi:hypothetical protein
MTSDNPTITYNKARAMRTLFPAHFPLISQLLSIPMSSPQMKRASFNRKKSCSICLLNIQSSESRS